MATSFDDVHTFMPASSSHRFGTGDHVAHTMGTCPNCDAKQFAVIAFTTSSKHIWLRCVNCGIGVVQNNNIASPPALPLRTPQGVTGEELQTWEEVRQCLGVNANTAAVMLCRKILMHVAVAHGLPAQDDKGRGPTYAACVNHLITEGIITNRMRPWVDRIKDVGNEANHQLDPVPAAQASDVANFTMTLLQLAYEMDHAMAAADPGTASA